MNNILHAQFIVSGQETADKLIYLRKQLTTRLVGLVKTDEPRAVAIQDKGAGWVLDAYIKLGTMSLKEAHQEASKIGEIYQYALE
jgi:hypothetical protein